MFTKGARQLAKNFSSRAWRLNNIYNIVDKQGHKILFKQNPIQQRIFASSASRKQILKFRQPGVSTGCILDFFDKTIWNENQTTMIMSHDQPTIKKLFRIVQRAYRWLDPALKPALDRGGGSKYEYYFPAINSRIYVGLESTGDTIQNLHISEAAQITDWNNRVYPTIETVPIVGGCVNYESTPRGMNEFYDTWTDPEQFYEKFFFPWYIFPEYAIPCKKLQLTAKEQILKQMVLKEWKLVLSDAQINFRRFKQKSLGGLFVQEYPEDDISCFLASGQSPCDLNLIKGLLDNSHSPIFEDDIVKVYKGYDKKRRYAIGVDVAEGYGGDYCVASVMDIESREQVAQLRGKWKPYEFAHLLNKLANEYQEGGSPHPILAVERNNHGHAVLLELKENIKYPNLYYAQDERPGWLTDLVTRPIMMDTFIEGTENKTVRINDKTTFTECLTLRNKNGKIEAEQNKHDDCVIASAICLQVCIENRTDIYTNMRESIYV